MATKQSIPAHRIFPISIKTDMEINEIIEVDMFGKDIRIKAVKQKVDIDGENIYSLEIVNDRPTN